MTGYRDSIGEIQKIIADISESSGIFVSTVQSIQKQIQEISDVPDSKNVRSEDIMKQVSETERAAEEMTSIVRRNKENANAINDVVARFSIS